MYSLQAQIYTFCVNVCSSVVRQIVNKHFSFNYIYFKSNFINEFVLFARMEMQLPVFNKD